MSDLTCPDCKGKGTTVALVDGRTSQGKRFGGMRELNCPTCKGTRTITPEHAQRIENGERRRQDRIARGLSVREEAERLGITPRELNAIEHGREA